METWYRVTDYGSVFMDPHISELKAIRSTDKILFRASHFGKEKREAKNTTWYRTFAARDEAVRRVEEILSGRVYLFRSNQEAAIEGEREAIESLARLRKAEAILPGANTFRGEKDG